MTTHPPGVHIDIVGLKQYNNGRSCNIHGVCGSIAKKDMVVRIQKVQVLNKDGDMEDALAVHAVNHGRDGCRIGFLPRYCVKYWTKYHGAVAQITEIYSDQSFDSTKRRKHHQNCGCCDAIIISLTADDSE